LTLIAEATKKELVTNLASIETRRVMRAARIVEPRKAIVEEARIPEPGPRQVRIRVEGCGVCASNLGPWLGLPWLKYPFSPGQSGHEVWGEIDDVGAEVRNLRPGDRVSAISYDGYAEYDVAGEDAVVKLPDSLAHEPFPGEPLGCAMNVLRRSDIRAGQTIAIVGIGFMGALLTRLASAAGAHVIAISRRDCALETARAMGASELIPMRDHAEIIARVQELTAGELCERVIEAVGAQWPLDLAAELTGTGGKLIVAGYHQDGPRQVNMQLWNWRGIDVVNAHERALERYVEGVEAAVAAVDSRQLNPAPLYTHRYSLEDLGQALDATFERPAGFMKALVIP
jgi:threonine dehydrogenase-like Zn-dependent dehydrogenase